MAASRRDGAGGEGERFPDTATGLWTIHNRRYNLTSFLDAHPGGRFALELARGRNCTELFESYHSLAGERPRAMLAAYYVEDAARGDHDYAETFSWASTPFYDALKARVRAHFRGRSHKATPAMWLHHVVMVALVVLCYPSLLRGNWLALLVVSVAYFLGPAAMLHDGSHFSLSKWAWLNRVCAYVGSAHSSVYMWDHQHTIAHHSYTGLHGCDPDLYHFTIGARSKIPLPGIGAVGLPGFRPSPSLRPLPTRLGRHAWLLGWLTRALLTTFGPSVLEEVLMYAPCFPFGGSSYLGIIALRRHSRARLAAHFAGRAVVVFLGVVLPFAALAMAPPLSLTSLAKAFAFGVLPFAVNGMYYYAVSQVSHIQEACFASTADEGHPLVNNEWAIHQVQHTVDYGITDALTKHMSVGLNNQAVHHLFPQVAWVHYDALAPILERTCREFGVTYRHHRGFAEAFFHHMLFLKRVNESDVYAAPKRRMMSQATLKFLGEVARPAAAAPPTAATGDAGSSHR